MTYFNTNQLEGKALIESRMKDHYLRFRILKVFREMRIPLAPHQVKNALPDGFAIPITSVRRAMSCLTRDLFLVKLDRDKMITGEYNTPVHRWKLV